MKKLLWLALLCPALIFAQTEKITFTKKLTYITGAEYGDLANVELYYSTKGILVDMDNKKRLIKDGVMPDLKLDLDNNAKFINNGYYSYLDSLPTYKFEKLREKDVIGGYNCTYYQAINKESYYNRFKMCIVEDSSLDMISLMNNNEGDKIKGFPVAVNTGNNALFLKSIKNYSNSITVDFKGELTQAQEEVKRYREMYGEDNNYGVAPADSIAVDTEPYYEEDSYYKSEYKEVDKKETETDLAIDNLERSSYYWKQIPSYCKELDQRIPAFKDKELKKHARNYAGQTCDLYYSFEDEYSVDRRGTLDQIRYEENYFRNTKFDKKDQKLLDEFLNGLD